MNKNRVALDSILERMDSLLRQQSAKAMQDAGLYGHEFVTDDSHSSKVFGKIAAWAGAAAQVDYTIVKPDGTTQSFSNIALQDGGEAIYGRITGLNVDSGAVIAYYAVDFK